MKRLGKEQMCDDGLRGMGRRFDRSRCIQIKKSTFGERIIADIYIPFGAIIVELELVGVVDAVIRLLIVLLLVLIDSFPEFIG